MAAIVKAAARLPLLVLRGPAGFAMLLAGIKRRRVYNIAVAGLDESKAQPIWFTLRRAASSPEEQAIADTWLEALQLCQVASGLLLRELDEVEANLQFWCQRERRGNHFLFSLLCRGPMQFARRLAVLLRLQQPVAGEMNEADLVEKRVLIFRLLRSALCEALARVQDAASMLYLQQQQHQLQHQAQQAQQAGRARRAAQRAGTAAAALPAAGAGAGGAVGDDEGDQEEGLFQRADRLVTASLAEVADAFHQLDRSVHDTLDAQQGPAGPPDADWAVLHGALTRVLGLQHLRQVLSRHHLLGPAQQQQEGQQGQGAGAGGGAGQIGPAGPGQQQEISAAAGEIQVAAAAGGPLAAQAALRQARQAVGFTVLLPANSTVHSALQAAQRSVHDMHGRRLIQVPRWALMPSQLQQHWIHVSAAGLVAGYTTLFLYRHSRLAGSRDLDRWITRGLEAVRGAWRDHVVHPLASLRAELFDTFRRRHSIVSAAEFESGKESLQRMLDDFQRDFVRKHGEAAAAAELGIATNPTAAVTPNPTPGSSTAAAGTAASTSGAAGSGASAAGNGTGAGTAPAAAAAAVLVPAHGDMDLVMRAYEREMRSPLRNLVAGELVRALLIQIQKVKVDSAAAMLEIDQILKANELTISLLAAVPSFIIAGGGLYYLGRLVTPSPPDPRREALGARLAMIEVERSLEQVAVAEEAARAAARLAAEEAEGEAGSAAKEAAGLFTYRLAVAYEEIRELFRRHRGLIALGSSSEWSNIRADLLGLASPAESASRMRTSQRMMRSYAIFQQF